MKIAAFGVEDWLNVWEKSATYDIAQSTISSMTMEEIRALDDTNGATMYERFEKEKMNYGWIEGSPEFKEAAARLYEHVDPENILQTNGGTGANWLALFALVEPGDHVISEYPSYQQLYDIPRALGAEVDLWRIREEDNWFPDLEELKKLVRKDTKLICINNSNNPTGTFMPRSFVEQIVEIADSVGAYVFSDEVFRPLKGDDQFASVVDLYDKGIATHSLSKTFSVPGVRVGWTATNAELAERFRIYRDYTMICCGPLNDIIATHVLQNKEKVYERNRKLVFNNLEIAQNWINEEPRVSWIAPQAVSTSFIKLDIPQDSEEFCKDLLRDEGVLLVPGNRFDLPGYARLGYCAQEEILREGLKRLSGYLRKFD